MAAILSEDEKARSRHHLGYMGVSDGSTFALGVPAAVQTSFIIERSFDKVMESALPTFRRLLAILDALEGQMVDDHELLAVEQIDTIKVNTKEQEALDRRYLRWQAALANLLGVPPNPFDQRFGAGAGGVNVRVGH